MIIEHTARDGEARADPKLGLLLAIRVSIERVAHHQEDTCRTQSVGLQGYRFGRRIAKYDFIHLTEQCAT